MSYFCGQSYPVAKTPDALQNDWGIYSRPSSVFSVPDISYLQFTAPSSPFIVTSANSVMAVSGTQPAVYSQQHTPVHPNGNGVFQNFSPPEQTRGRRRRKTSIDKVIVEACKIDYMEVLRSQSENRSYNLRPRRNVSDPVPGDYNLNSYSSNQREKNQGFTRTYQDGTADHITQCGTNAYSVKQYTNQHASYRSVNATDLNIHPYSPHGLSGSLSRLNDVVANMPKKRKYTRRSTRQVQVIDLTGSENGNENTSYKCVSSQNELNISPKMESSKKYSQKEMDIGEALVSLNSSPTTDNTVGRQDSNTFQDLNSSMSFSYSNAFGHYRQGTPNPIGNNNITQSGSHVDVTKPLNLSGQTSSYNFSIANPHSVVGADCMIYSNNTSYSAYTPLPQSPLDMPPPAYHNKGYNSRVSTVGFHNDFYAHQPVQNSFKTEKEQSRRRSERLLKTSFGSRIDVSASNWDKGRSSPKTPQQKTEKPRTRMTYSKDQNECLELSYQNNRYLKPAERSRLANIIGVEEKKIKIWFQNRRMRGKKANEDKNVSTPKTGRGRKANNLSASKDCGLQMTTATYPRSMQSHTKSPNQAFEYPMAKTPILPAAQFANSVSSAINSHGLYTVPRCSSFGGFCSSLPVSSTLSSSCNNFPTKDAMILNTSSATSNPCETPVSNYLPSGSFLQQFSDCLQEAGNTSVNLVVPSPQSVYQPMSVGNPNSHASQFSQPSTPLYGDMMSNNPSNLHLNESPDNNYMSSVPATPQFVSEDMENTCAKSETSLSPPQLVINEDYCEQTNTEFTSSKQNASLEELVISKKITSEGDASENSPKSNETNLLEIPILSPCVAVDNPPDRRKYDNDIFDLKSQTPIVTPTINSFDNNDVYNPELQSLERMLSEITPKDASLPKETKPKRSSDNSSMSYKYASARLKPNSSKTWHKSKNESISSDLFGNFGWKQYSLHNSDITNRSLEKADSYVVNRSQSSHIVNADISNTSNNQDESKDADIRIIGESAFKINIDNFPSAPSSLGMGSKDSSGEQKFQHNSPIIKPRAIRAGIRTWHGSSVPSVSDNLYSNPNSTKRKFQVFDGIVIKDEPKDEFSTSIKDDSFLFNYSNPSTPFSQSDSYSNYNISSNPASPFNVPSNPTSPFHMSNSPSSPSSASSSYSGIYMAQPIPNPSLSRGYHHLYSTVNSNVFCNSKETSDSNNSTFFQL